VCRVKGGSQYQHLLSIYKHILWLKSRQGQAVCSRLLTHKLTWLLQEWNKSMQALQAKTPLTEKPKVTLEDVALKLTALDREVKYLVNKMKSYRPKTKPKAAKESNKTNSGGNETETFNGTSHLCLLTAEFYSFRLLLILSYITAIISSCLRLQSKVNYSFVLYVLNHY